MGALRGHSTALHCTALHRTAHVSQRTVSCVAAGYCSTRSSSLASMASNLSITGSGRSGYCRERGKEGGREVTGRRAGGRVWGESPQRQIAGPDGMLIVKIFIPEHHHLSADALLHPLVEVEVLGALPQELGLGRLPLGGQVRLQPRHAARLHAPSAASSVGEGGEQCCAVQCSAVQYSAVHWLTARSSQ